jgi:hypothetical protein
MRYMMLIYSQEDESVTHDDMSAVAAAHRAVMEEARQRGVFCSAEPLQASVTATTLRVHDGATMVTDGPFAETKEQISGYFLLDCADLDQAIAWARRIPGARHGAVEVRPVLDMGELMQ